MWDICALLFSVKIIPSVSPVLNSVLKLCVLQDTWCTTGLVRVCWTSSSHWASGALSGKASLISCKKSPPAKTSRSAAPADRCAK